MKTDEIVEPPLYVYPPPKVDMPISSSNRIELWQRQVLFDNVSASCHLRSPGRLVARNREETYTLITILLQDGTRSHKTGVYYAQHHTKRDLIKDK